MSQPQPLKKIIKTIKRKVVSKTNETKKIKPVKISITKFDKPSFEEEVSVVKNTTSSVKVSLDKILTIDQILVFQDLVRRIPITDNVLQYAVKLSSMTRPENPLAPEIVKNYVSWGAGPRASQYLVLGAKCHALMTGKYAPDNEDVKQVAHAILRHRIVRNYKAEAEGIRVERIIDELIAQ